MNFKLSKNLFLGSSEMSFLKTSIVDGYKNIIKSSATSYGVVVDGNGINFNNLKVTSGSVYNKFNLTSGSFVDSELNYVNVSGYSDIISLDSSTTTQYIY